jgi:hypothetical protein
MFSQDKMGQKAAIYQESYNFMDVPKNYFFITWCNVPGESKRAFRGILFPPTLQSF